MQLIKLHNTQYATNIPRQLIQGPVGKLVLVFLNFHLRQHCTNITHGKVEAYLRYPRADKYENFIHTRIENMAMLG